MKWLTRIFHRNEEIDREIDEELRFHIETRIERYIQTGMTPEANVSLGNLHKISKALRITISEMMKGVEKRSEGMTRHPVK